MFQIGVRKRISSAHFLRGHKGKCENLHGHNWSIEVVLSKEELDHMGMVMDFGVVKDRLQQILNRLDHQIINEHPYFEEHNPSSEELARFIHDEMLHELGAGPGEVSVTVHETEDCWARYFHPEPLNRA